MKRQPNCTCQCSVKEDSSGLVKHNRLFVLKAISHMRLKACDRRFRRSLVRWKGRDQVHCILECEGLKTQQNYQRWEVYMNSYIAKHVKVKSFSQLLWPLDETQGRSQLHVPNPWGCVWSGPHVGPLLTRAKSHDHEVVRALENSPWNCESPKSFPNLSQDTSKVM